MDFIRILKTRELLLLIPEYDLFSIEDFFIANKTFSKNGPKRRFRYDLRTLKDMITLLAQAEMSCLQ